MNALNPTAYKTARMSFQNLKTLENIHLKKIAMNNINPTLDALNHTISKIDQNLQVIKTYSEKDRANLKSYYTKLRAETVSKKENLYPSELLDQKVNDIEVTGAIVISD